MNDPVRAGEIIRVFDFTVFARVSCLKPFLGLQENKADWYVGRKEDFREPFKNRTLALSEAWKKERAAKEGAKTDAPEGAKGDGTDDREENVKEKDEKAKDKQTEAIPIEESDDEIVISDVRPAPKAAQGGRKASGVKAVNSGRAERLRG